MSVKRKYLLHLHLPEAAHFHGHLCLCPLSHSIRSEYFDIHSARKDAVVSIFYGEGIGVMVKRKCYMRKLLT